MKMIIILMSLILLSCKSTVPNKTEDLLTALIAVHQDGKLEGLTSKFGPPTRIENTKESNVVKYVYDKTSPKQYSFETFVDAEKKEVISSSTLFWKSDDDYELLKSRFGNYLWIEKYTPTSPHPLRELYKVTIPDLGITFEYDKLAPKIMWIYFQKPN